MKKPPMPPLSWPRSKIGCLPVVKKGKLVGMLTSTDILRAYVKLAHEVDKMFKNLDR